MSIVAEQKYLKAEINLWLPWGFWGGSQNRKVVLNLHGHMYFQGTKKGQWDFNKKPNATHYYRLDFMFANEQRNSLNEWMAMKFNYLPLFSVAYLPLILEE